MTIGELYVSLKADTKEFEASMQASLTKTQGFVKGHEAQFKKIGAAVTVAGAAITAALGSTIKSYANAGDAAAKMSQRTGLSVENIMKLKHAADLSDTSIEGLETGIKRMARVISDAGYGLETAERPLKELGISLDTLKGKHPDEQFNMLATALANVEDPMKKAALAQEIFGRAGTQLLPMLSDGAAGLEKMKQEADDLGLVMSDEAAGKAEVFNDAITSLKGSLQGVRNSIAQNIMPLLTPLIQKITDVIKQVTEWSQRNPGLSKALILIAGAVGVLATVLGPLIMALPMIMSGVAVITTALPFLGAAFAAISGPIGIIVGALAVLFLAGKYLIKNWDDIKEGAKIVWDGIVGFVKAGVNLYIGYLNTLIKAVLGGINLIIAGLNKIPKVNIPSIPVPQIPTLHEGGIYQAPTPGGEGLAMLRDRERVIPAGVSESAANMGGGVRTIQVNNPLSPEDLERIVRMVRRDNMMTSYVKGGLQGA